MKMFIKSSKPSYNLPPLNNIVDDIEANIVYDDNEKCDLFNKYFSCISGIDDENVLLPDFESRTVKAKLGDNLTNKNYYPS
jgi:hypothetical protein